MLNRLRTHDPPEFIPYSRPPGRCRQVPLFDYATVTFAGANGL
jgi:hypothetical protein